MEPQIQYTSTSDGVSIAYAVLGEGTPLVLTTSAWGRLHIYTHGPIQPKLEDRLAAAGLRVMIYDGRGVGYSDRSATDFSAEARMLDLDAVIAASGVERFVLAYAGTGGSQAVTYAIRRREGVSHFIIVNPMTGIRDLREAFPVMRVARGMEAIATEDWEMFTLTMANALNEFADSETARKIAEAYRSGMEPAAWVAYYKASVEQTDPSDLLPSLDLPALVIYDSLTGGKREREVAQRLAPLIPKARFVETNDAAHAIAEFVGASTARARDNSLPSGTAIILFADIADSTALTERLGDAAFRAKARDLDAALRTVIRKHAGTPIEGKLLGDGVLAVFTSARQAIEAALACGRSGNEAGLPLHLGLHAGDVIREDNNVYGGAVNIASRISGLSAPGEVLVSETVRSLARTSAGVRFEDRGEQPLKGVGEPVRVWAVKTSEEALQ